MRILPIPSRDVFLKTFREQFPNHRRLIDALSNKRIDDLYRRCLAGAELGELADELAKEVADEMAGLPPTPKLSPISSLEGEFYAELCGFVRQRSPASAVYVTSMTESELARAFDRHKRGLALWEISMLHIAERQGVISAEDKQNEVPQTQTERKPPLGVMPERIWKEHRAIELAEAFARFINEGKAPNREWLDEFDKLMEELYPLKTDKQSGNETPVHRIG